MNYSVIIEGIDRIGKGTQIQLLKTFLTKKNNKSTHIIHYSYFKNMDSEESKYYSEKLYNDMFWLLASTNFNIICDRSHIGEYVYSKMYREYDGNYVFDIEKKFINMNGFGASLNEGYGYNIWDYYKTELILLVFYTDDIDTILSRYDGESLSNNKKELIEQEQLKFHEAFKKSNIKRKGLINVTNKTPEEIFNEIRKYLR